MAWIIYKPICILWSNAISVKTSAMNSSRQPKIRVLKLNGGPCSLLVANAESCQYAVHSSCVNFFLKKKFGAQNICLDIYIKILFTHTVSVPCI